MGQEARTTHPRARGRFGRLGVMAGAAIASVALVASAAGAAGTVTLTPGKGGTNADGSCQTVTGTGTTQVWQFNLTGIKSGGENATLSATFTTGSVSGLSPDKVNGGVAMWFVTTSSTAKLVSATADGTNVEFGPGNSNLVVSHCTRSGGSSGPS